MTDENKSEAMPQTEDEALAEEARKMAQISSEYVAMTDELAELNALEAFVDAHDASELGGVYGSMLGMLGNRK
ncbi:MAG: hypothetical protein K6F70_01630 [Eggerthellaceae bacterium]|uniref:Uncharacterized protein n=1 Tax=Denitrobacterium detoxificans TaxID=79604 RepID=A0A172RWM1_9ACTN|nr:hypothetical protein [Denitrobacterium detoxificans]ANE22122.1 hypothetical protein AAY81_01990 [Denitrobacterium detoxificans]MCR5582306.1 hypothetical protein [Eggerthellaceae bacterium]SEO85003.1 hypothetical protein SAMN02910314_01394 [Denitrobacterium detoxificans]